MLRTLLFSMALLTPATSGQTTASIVPYGSTCGLSPLATQGLPQIGTTFHVIAQQPCGFGFPCLDYLVMGLRQTSIPFSHPGFTWGTGCTVLVTNDIALPVYGLPPRGIPIAVPNRAALLGFQFNLQYARVGLSWCCGMSLTDALHCTVGV